MFFSFFTDFFCLLPELFFAIAILFVLIYGSFVSNLKNIYVNKTFVLRESFFCVSVFLFFCVLLLNINNPCLYSYLFFDTLVFDTFSFYFKIIIISITLICIIFFKKGTFTLIFNSFEFFILLQLAVFGTLLILNSNDFLSFYLALELQSLSFYSLGCFNRQSAFSVEASLKYFILGAFASGFFLFGASLVYGATGTTNFLLLSDFFSLGFTTYNFYCLIVGLIFMLIGILFKLSVAPFHYWAVDVYEGVPSFLTLFFLVLPKLGFFSVLIKICFISFYSYMPFLGCFLGFAGIVSLVVGSFNALFQKKLKRFFLYSSISHIGFLLSGLCLGSFEGVVSFCFYIQIYFLITILCWAFFIVLEKNSGIQPKYFEDLENLLFENKPLALTIGVVFFSFAGIPPLAGFFSKFFIFFSVVDSHFWLLALVLIVISTVSCFYYLRFIKVIFFKPKKKTSFFQINSHTNSILTKPESLLFSCGLVVILYLSANAHIFYFFSYKLSLHFLS